jgi:Carbon dioxide concentrating mechanism/carboxysome shell protein
MQLAKVVGSVVATRKEESLSGLKLLLVRPVDEEARRGDRPRRGRRRRLPAPGRSS